MKKLLALVLAMAMALSLAACGSGGDTDGGGGESKSLTVVVTDLEGKEETFTYTTTAATVGEALQAEGLVEGEPGDYGLYITAVNGIAADWDKDQTYWAFYIDGEYATTGIDQTDITEGAEYSLVLTKG